jgi:pre-mRNA-processing factor 8
MPKNLLKRFVCIADLKVQIFGYLYGSTVEGMVREIKCIVLVPQTGGRDSVTVPHQMPESEFLKGLEPMGWIHTSPEDKNTLTLHEAFTHVKFVSDNSSWQLDKSIVLNVGFTPGSVSLTAYKVNLSGY